VVSVHCDHAAKAAWRGSGQTALANGMHRS
jgi:hypothetical protein